MAFISYGEDGETNYNEAYYTYYDINFDIINLNKKYLKKYNSTIFSLKFLFFYKENAFTLII